MKNEFEHCHFCWLSRHYCFTFSTDARHFPYKSKCFLALSCSQITNMYRFFVRCIFAIRQRGNPYCLLKISQEKQKRKWCARNNNGAKSVWERFLVFTMNAVAINFVCWFSSEFGIQRDIFKLIWNNLSSIWRANNGNALGIFCLNKISNFISFHLINRQNIC